MENKRNPLPRYTFDGYGALALLLGGIIPQGILLIFMQTGVVFLHDMSLLLLIGTMVMWLGAIISFNYCICKRQTGRSLRFDFSVKNASTLAMSASLFFGMVLIANSVVKLIPTKGKFWGDWYQSIEEMMWLSLQSPWLMFTTAVIIAPIFEEIVFRGIILKGLLNRGVSPTVSIWISALLFGFIHGNPWQFVGATMLGFALGLIYHQTKTLFIPILLHALNNGLAFALIYFTGEDTLQEFSGISSGALFCIGLVVYGFSYYFFTEKFKVLHP